MTHIICILTGCVRGMLSNLILSVAIRHISFNTFYEIRMRKEKYYITESHILAQREENQSECDRKEMNHKRD